METRDSGPGLRISKKPGLGVSISIEFHQIAMRLEELLPGKHISVAHSVTLGTPHRDHLISVEVRDKETLAEKTYDPEAFTYMGQGYDLDSAWKDVFDQILKSQETIER